MIGDGKEWTNIGLSGLQLNSCSCLKIPMTLINFVGIRLSGSGGTVVGKRMKKGGCNFWRAGVSIAMLQGTPLPLDSELM